MFSENLSALQGIAAQLRAAASSSRAGALGTPGCSRRSRTAEATACASSSRAETRAPQLGAGRDRLTRALSVVYGIEP